MDHVIGLKCVQCGRRHSVGEVEYTCVECGPTGILDVLYDYERIAATTRPEDLAGRGVFRYRPLLPVPGEGWVPPLQAGDTPLVAPERLRSELSAPGLFLKDDGRNPTASLKDRASAVGLARARSLGATAVTAASTGNAACSLAGLAAASGVPCFIFVPATAPRGKLAQLQIYGATVFAVEDSYEACFELSCEATARHGWYNRNCAYNPYLVEGKKTLAFEVAEQLQWHVPDRVVVSVGDGCIISGVYKGFKDLLALGWTERLPRMVAVQAAGASPVVRAFSEGTELQSVVPETLADSIAVGTPRNGLKALQALRGSRGCAVTVTDEEILQAMSSLASQAGVFGEPAGVAGFAGYRKLLEAGEIGREEKVLVLVTGSGLKDVESAFKAVGEPHRISADISEVEKVLGRS